MSSVKYPLIGGRRMRLTRTDACGVPAWGNFAMIVSKGFVSVAVTANYDDGTEIVLKNAADERDVQRDADAELINLQLAILFTKVDPELYTAFTGFPTITDPATGEVIGFKINRGVRPSHVRNGLEVWADAQGNGACDDDQAVPYGYLLWPLLGGGRVTDYTIENGAVSFGVNTVLSKDGTGWGVGPYNVVTDADGDPAPLEEALTEFDHQVVLRTTIAPPEVTDGLVPLDDPDTAAATTATAGIPGTWNGVRPADLAALLASSITGSGGASAWTTGQYVILGDGSTAHWAGSGATPKWVAGPAT
jgi:hypothetical protein